MAKVRPKKEKKPYMGRIPVPKPDFEFKSKKRYSRKKKYKPDWRDYARS